MLMEILYRTLVIALHGRYIYWPQFPQYSPSCACCQHRVTTMFRYSYATVPYCPPDIIWCQSHAKMYQALLLLFVLFGRWSLGTRLVSLWFLCKTSQPTISQDIKHNSHDAIYPNNLTHARVERCARFRERRTVAAVLRGTSRNYVITRYSALVPV